jgi:hypothetical protein
VMPGDTVRQLLVRCRSRPLRQMCLRHQRSAAGCAAFTTRCGLLQAFDAGVVVPWMMMPAVCACSLLQVNEMLGKPLFDCNRVMERWRDGPADGSCG